MTRKTVINRPTGFATAPDEHSKYAVFSFTNYVFFSSAVFSMTCVGPRTACRCLLPIDTHTVVC